MNKKAQEVWDYIQSNKHIPNNTLKVLIATKFGITEEMAVSAIFRWGLNDKEWFNTWIK